MGVKGFELKLIALAKEVDTTFKNSVKATFIDAVLFLKCSILFISIINLIIKGYNLGY